MEDNEKKEHVKDRKEGEEGKEGVTERKTDGKADFHEEKGENMKSK